MYISGYDYIYIYIYIYMLHIYVTYIHCALKLQKGHTKKEGKSVLLERGSTMKVMVNVMMTSEPSVCCDWLVSDDVGGSVVRGPQSESSRKKEAWVHSGGARGG